MRRARLDAELFPDATHIWRCLYIQREGIRLIFTCVSTCGRIEAFRSACVVQFVVSIAKERNSIAMLPYFPAQIALKPEEFWEFLFENTNFSSNRSRAEYLTDFPKRLRRSIFERNWIFLVNLATLEWSYVSSPGKRRVAAWWVTQPRNRLAHRDIGDFMASRHLELWLDCWIVIELSLYRYIPILAILIIDQGHSITILQSTHCCMWQP